ncbi:uncharacterized protein [Physcomitrium patens]|uniref:Uncharacterized protein n=1 Tax=Physcomitrium patens TaxID=3218 RepID=A9S4L7_PHYPA|nr:heat shock 70 kDa protein 12A-like [Physcomitrium patens]XP_024371023.1 heat shock 70 kDa protein 12A-like [Physcomitrium patens]XP_024371024.1 heat shock 70 kDa protein 12A-like [Physcomitrium patens]PNR57772.1 hypothetical protein PHYPA_004766 [Physcomitrium patens]|eukprot:XP_024371022.1 heat shock 70 kDa protein 12A-like [Physcomitrella patens]
MANSPISSLEPRVVVGLDFGTTYSGFAFAHVTDPEKIYAHFDYPKATGEKHYCKTVTACYYKKRADGVGGWKFKSWGYPARAEYEKDILTVRRHRSSDPNEDPSQPTIGQFFVRFKLHLASPSSAPKLPDWLKVDVLITDYLREMGGLILRTLQDHYGAGLTKEAIQWCITVPSIWDLSAKAVMKNCMVNAGLVGGIDGSPHPLVMVLEPEAASFHCHKVMSQEFLEVGDKLLVADIGGGTSDIVVQEVISVGSNYRVKEVTTSSGGLCGGTYVDARFMEFMHRTIGPCFRECLDRHPNVQVALMKSWETAKSSFGDPATREETIDLNLPTRLVALWEAYDQTLGNPERESYDELEITYKQMQSIFDPVVKENLRLISRQLDQVGTVKMLVVVGGFAASPYLMENIKRKFSGVVPHILSPPNPGSAVCQGAVALALNPDTIESRVCKRTYGFSCTYKFERGVDPPEYMKVVDGVEKCRRRFQIFVRKGDKVRVDSCISRIQRPVTRGQKSIRFQLFSSDEIEPRYALGHSVKKEGEIVIDISRDMQKDKGREVKLSLFFGRSSLEIKAEAVNFMMEGPQQHLELPVEVDYCGASSPVHLETFKTF